MLFLKNGNTKQTSKLLININDEPNGTFQSAATLHENNSTRLITHGIIKVIDHAIVKIYIETENQLKILKNGNVIINLISTRYHQQQLQAFSVQMTPKVWDLKLNQLNSIFFDVWTSQENRNSFIDTNLFVPANGVLVAESDGLFVLNANIMLLSRENMVCTNMLVVKTNDNQNIITEEKDLKPGDRSTINLYTHIRFSKNDRVWLEITSTCDNIRIYPQSTFSFSLISEDAVGFSFTTSGNISLTNNTGRSFLDLSIFKSINSKQDDNLLQIGSYNMTCLTKGFLYISLDFNLDKLSTDRLDENNAARILINIFDLTEAISLQKVQAKSNRLYLIFERTMKKGDIVTFHLFLPSSGKQQTLLKGSFISANIVPSQEPLIGNEILAEIKLNEKWSPLKECVPIHAENLKKIAESVYGVMENGVYIFNANFEFVEIEDTIDIELALMYTPKNKQQKTLLYTMESGISSKKSLRLSSTLSLTSGHGFQLYVRSIGKVQSVKGTCSFDLKLLGDHNSIVGFQANLEKDFVIQGTSGFFTINNFQTLEDDPQWKSFNYNTYRSFNYSKGEFKAPFSGIYLISLNLVAKHLIMISEENYAAAMIKINKKDSIFFALKQHKSRPSTSTSSTDGATRNTTTSFCMTGQVHLNDHDELKIEFLMHGDDHWEIDARSSFSIVLLTQKLNGFLVYRPSVNKLKPTDDPKEKIISGWEEIKTLPPYGGFVGTTKSSPTLQESSTIFFAVDGWYSISINISLRQHKTKDGSPEITLKLVKESSLGNDSNSANDYGNYGNVIHCDRLVLDFDVAPSGCQLTRRFNKGERYTVRIRSNLDLSDIISNNFYDGQANDQNMAYLSVSLLNEVVNFQSAMLNLQVNL